MYKAINRFKEEIHDDHIYEIDDPYPTEGKKLVKARAEFLTKVHEEYGIAFLKKTVEEPKKTPTKQAPKQPSTDEKSDA